jgi:hypothetical protein
MTLSSTDDPVMQWCDNPLGIFSDGTMYSCFGGLPGVADPWSSNDDLDLFSKLRDKIAGSSFHAGNFLAEGHQALEMIGDRATRILGAGIAARHGDFKKAANWLIGGGSTASKTPIAYRAANNWLELQYGWLPLLQDVHAGAQMLQHQLSTPPKQRVRVSKTAYGENPGNPSNLRPSSWENYTRKNVILEVESVNMPVLSGLLDPLSVAWEVTPYSFVVDWFIPVGNFLSAMAFDSAVTGKFVISRKRLIRAESWQYHNPPGYTWTVDAPGFKEVRVQFDRTVGNTYSPPLPAFKGLQKAASWQHAANALALLTQKFPRSWLS